MKTPQEAEIKRDLTINADQLEYLYLQKKRNKISPVEFEK